MNSEQFDTLDSSVAQYDPMLTLSLNLDLLLPLTDMMTNIMIMTHKTVLKIVVGKKKHNSQTPPPLYSPSILGHVLKVSIHL